MLYFDLCTKLSERPLFLKYVIVYVPSNLLVFVYVWFCGFKEELAKTAYRDIWINFTSLFTLLCIISTVISIYKEKKSKTF